MTIAAFLSTFAVLWAGLIILFLVGYGLYRLSEQDRPPHPTETWCENVDETITRERVEMIDMKGYHHADAGNDEGNG